MGDDNSDFFLAIILVVILLVGGIFVVAMFNKDIFDLVKNKDVRESRDAKLGVNLSNGTIVIVPISVRVVDSDTMGYLSPSYSFYHVVNDTLDFVRAGFFVGNVEVFNETILNDSYVFRAWVNGTNFSNYYSGSFNFTVRDERDFKFSVVKKGVLNVSITEQQRDLVVLNLSIFGRVRTPIVFFSYGGLFDPSVVGWGKCRVPSELLYVYDRCYSYGRFVNESFFVNVSFLPLSDGWFDFRFSDVDIVDGADNLFVNDVPDVYLMVDVNSSLVS